MSDKSISMLRQGKSLIFNTSITPETNGQYKLGSDGCVFNKLYTNDHFITSVYVGSNTCPLDNTNVTSEYMIFNPTTKRLTFRTVTGFSSGSITTQSTGYLSF